MALITKNAVKHDGEDASMASDPVNDTREYPCLVRVTDGKEVNFSTRVCIRSFNRYINISEIPLRYRCKQANSTSSTQSTAHC